MTMPTLDQLKDLDLVKYTIVVLLALLAVYCKTTWFPLLKREGEARIAVHDAVAKAMPKIATGLERVSEDTHRLPGIEAKVEAIHEDVRRIASVRVGVKDGPASSALAG